MYRSQPSIWAPGINLFDPSAEGLVFAAPCWEAGGNVAYNYSGSSGRDLTFGSGAQAPSWGYSPYGPAITFAGNDYAATATLDGTLLNDDAGVLFSCFANPANQDQLAALIAHRIGPGTFHQRGLDITGGWNGGSGTAGQKFAAFTFTIGDGAYYVITQDDVCDGDWHHYAALFVYDDTIYLYVDGVPMATTTSESDWSRPTTDRPLFIGARDSSGTDGFTGSIAGVWCANTANLATVYDPWGPYRRRNRLAEWVAATSGGAVVQPKSIKIGPGLPHGTAYELAP